MVGYLKSKKGYFYKLKKNGGKKRISQEEYKKKNKTRKNKKMIGGMGEPIFQSDIMYQDNLVCILRPEVKKGIIVWTHYTPPVGMNSLCNFGLKTGKKLNEEGIYFGRTKIHPYIFFRAPYFSRVIDYTTVETEIVSSYGEGIIGTEPKVFIRVDPDNTFVFSSELRDLYPEDIEKSKKTLSDYLKIIYNNAILYQSLMPVSVTKMEPAYDLLSSELVPVPVRVPVSHTRWGFDEDYEYEDYYSELPYPLIDVPIQRNSEILVSIPHLTPEYFVLCTP